MILKDAVRRFFPRAEKGRVVTLEQIDRLRSLGAYPSRTLLATSLCVDDINVASTGLAERLLGPFQLGGLAGLPYAGRTGMTAYAHHIPNDGAGFVFYGPHVGISDEGELGQVRRVGQAAESNCCGALLLALARFQEARDSGTRYHPKTDQTDIEQSLLEQSLEPVMNRVLDHPHPVMAITDVAYALIHERVSALLEETIAEFKARLVVTFGGVIINTGADREDYVEVRDHNVIRR